jgi:hypothetical protein
MITLIKEEHEFHRLSFVSLFNSNEKHLFPSIKRRLTLMNFANQEAIL